MLSRQRIALIVTESVSQISLLAYLLLLGQGLAFDPLQAAVLLLAGIGQFSFLSALLFSPVGEGFRNWIPGRVASVFLMTVLALLPWVTEFDPASGVMSALSPLMGVSASLSAAVLFLMGRRVGAESPEVP